MRIVGGRLKGRALTGPGTNAIRPTTDRTREALFNILAHGHGDVLDGARVLDLFSGTGALGLEALSRGAAFALFVEQSAEGRGLLRTNIEALGLQGVARIFRRDATVLGAIGTMQPFTLMFADPPYGKGLGTRALAAVRAGGWLVPGSLCVVEEAVGAPLEWPGYALVDERRWGDTIMRFLRFENAAD